MIALARDCGNDSLVSSLLDYLQSEFVGKAASQGRTAFAAINALAVITGTEFRFDQVGKPRPIERVAEDYRNLRN